MAALESLTEHLFTPHLISDELLTKCIRFARHWEETQGSLDDDEGDASISPTITASTTAFSLGFGHNALSSATSFDPVHDPHAVSDAEALSYYAGLHSEPILVYRTGKEWFPPSGPQAQRRKKELRPVFGHRIVDLWRNGLADEVTKVMDTHKILFTTIEVVRFKTVDVDEASSGEEDDDEKDDDEKDDDEKEQAKRKLAKEKLALGPVTIWVGVFPDSTRPSLAHKAAQDVLALLGSRELTDIDVDFRESFLTRSAGPQLLRPIGDLDPLVDVIGPLTPALGLRISTTVRPNAQGTMTLYLNEGDDNNGLLGLTCRHVLLSSRVGNLAYEYHPHMPPKNVIHLGKRAFANVTDSLQLRIGQYGISVRRWEKQIEEFERREQGNDANDVTRARADRLKTQALVEDAQTTMEALAHLLLDLDTHWKKISERVLGPILHSPPIHLGVGNERFTEDWGVFRLDRTKLGDGFQGNKIDLGTKMTPDAFTLKCFPQAANWEFEFPGDRLLPLMGTLSDHQMRHPDMWDTDGEPCLIVVKNGNATGTTLGRANGVFSIVRDYFPGDMTVNQTSMEWGIINYDSKSEVFSEPGDSGSIIADIRGRIGGMLTGGAGKTKSFDMTYATPYWWLHQRIRANRFPNANLNIQVI